MAQNITLLGASYSDVPSILLPKTGGGTAQFDDTTITSNAASASDILSGKLAYVNGTLITGTGSGGGSGIGTLLATKSLGSLSTSSTTAADTGKTVSVSSIDAYDLLIVETSVDTVVNNRHTCTVAAVFLTASNTVGTKNGYSIVTAKMNMKISNTGVTTTRVGTNAYGVYPNSATLSNGGISMPMYYRYSSANTGTLNGSYTTRVYGLKLYDMIGG